MIRFHSPHTPEECERRLKASVCTALFPLSTEKPFSGRVSNGSVSITRTIRYRNSFKPYFRGRLAASSSGTEIVGRIGLHPFARIFMYFWFGFLALFAAVALFGLVPEFLASDQAVDLGMTILIAVPFGLFVFGIALLKFGRHLARNEPGQLKAFICETLDARELPAHSTGASGLLP
ncbi:MAG TPA: hypothetical protein VEP29_07355 [Desulfatiglandales bacterium]|nr:hypothetical protein [Desulfatiglandales bacterium]